MNFDPKKLHVIRCYERLPPMPGGMERHIQQLTAAQRALGVRVTELYSRGEPAGESVQVWRGWPVDKLRPYSFRAAMFYAAAARRDFGAKDGRLLVVHIHGDWPSFLFGSMFAGAIDADAVAATVHEWARGLPQLYALSLKKCDPVFATGLNEARNLERITGRATVHLPSAPAEIFFSEPSLRSGPTDVIVVGSLISRKNVDLVLDIAERRPRLSIAIYGDGPERRRLESARARKRLGNVHFHGAVDVQTVHSAMWSSKLFLSTAIAEGSPTAALEAMACGTPVVLTPSNDYSDIVNQDENGRVTCGWSTDELVTAIDELLEDPLRHAQARAAARQTAQRHRWDEKAQLVTEAMIGAAERGLR